MNSISKEIVIENSIERTFDKFINEFNNWWPKEYTWSQDTLQEIKIDPKKDGLCTEIGPHGFRIDWGRITEFVKDEKVCMTWQISPSREPIPDPSKASDISIDFIKNGSDTVMKFEHSNFENHGNGAQDYRDMMDSSQGWDYILNAFLSYCEG